MAKVTPPNPVVNTNTWTLAQTFSAPVIDSSTLVVNGLATFNGGVSLPTLSYTSLANDYVNSTATSLSTGFGASVVAPASSRVLLMGNVQITNSTLGDAANLFLLRSLYPIPAAGQPQNGGAIADIIVWQLLATKQIAANSPIPAAFFVVDNGFVNNSGVLLTPGTTYYYYFVLTAPTGGSARLVGANNVTNLAILTL